jgi:hypothetical protein
MYILRLLVSISRLVDQKLLVGFCVGVTGLPEPLKHEGQIESTFRVAQDL